MTDSSEQKKDKTGEATLLTPLGAAAVGLGTGYAGAYSTIRERFNEDMRGVNRQSKHIRALRETSSDFFGKNSKRLTVGEYVDTIAAKKNNFAQEVTELLESKGIASKGLGAFTKGMWQRFQLMGRESKFSVAFNTGAAIAVGAGGAFMFMNNMHLRQKVDAANDKLDQLTQALHIQEEAKGL